MAEATANRFNAASRPPLWMVNYDLAPAFFKLDANGEYKAELADAENGVALLFEREWKAAYTTTDFKKGWILLEVGSQAEAEKLIQGYRMYQYFEDLTYTPVYSATQAGFNLKIIWDGFKKFFRDRF